MRRRLVSIALLSLVACSQPEKRAEAPAPADPFGGAKGCFLLYDVKAGAFTKEIGETQCRERLPACSTFKVPLAVMAFDSKVLKNENVVLKWDGKKDARTEVNRDHDAKTWMRDSVVWFSQQLTRKMGARRTRAYLEAFDYGNKDLSGGLTEAWLVSPSSPGPALKISAYEQVEFMKKLWSGALPVGERPQRLAREITFIEKSPNGFLLSGKTGSNFYDRERTRHLGWFIAHIQRADQEFIAVTNISDMRPWTGGGYGGPRARELTKKLLAEAGLW